ncbi:hypothetical protein [Dongia sp.]|uniref:hypothetical protein n=1 Tax=Dongia sp. TaxID=1977262 RepID=UPI0035AEDE6F
MRKLALIALLALSGCATEYWVKPGVGYKATAADLAECRKGAGNYAVMAQTEQPCMVGKGYQISTTPPTTP